MAKPSYEGPLEALELYEAVVAGNPDVDRKGAKNPYTSRNGHMFSFLDTEGTMALRMADDRREAFLERYDSGPVEAYGRTMRGYVRIPADLLTRTDELQPWFDESHRWIGTLKPNPTKRASAKKKTTKKSAAKKTTAKMQPAKKKKKTTTTTTAAKKATTGKKAGGSRGGR